MEWILEYGQLIGFGLTFSFGLLLIWITSKDRQDENKKNEVRQKVSIMKFLGFGIIVLSFAMLAKYVL